MCGFTDFFVAAQTKVDKIQITSELALKPSLFDKGALPVVILA